MALRAWVVHQRPLVHLQAAHLHTTRPTAVRTILLTSGKIKIKRKKPLKPLALPDGWEPFSISETLLDLDAYDAPGVRPYDAADELRQAAKWSDRPTKERLMRSVAEESPAFTVAHKRHTTLASRTYTSGKWRVGDIDLIGAALFQAPTRRSSASAGDQGAGEVKALARTTKLESGIAADLHLVLEKNGIPPLESLDHHNMLEWLIQREKEIPPFKIQNTDKYAKPIIRGSGAPYLSWKRHMTHFLLPNFGSTIILTQYQGFVVRAFRAHCTNKRARDLLILMGNIRATVEKQSGHLPGRYCQLGLALATVVGDTRAMQSYLHLCLVHRFKDISPDPSLYDVNALTSGVVRDPDGEVLLEKTEYNIHKLVMEQGGRTVPPESSWQDADQE